MNRENLKIKANLEKIVRILQEGAMEERDGFRFVPKDITSTVEKLNDNPISGRKSSPAKRLRKALKEIKTLVDETRELSLGKHLDEVSQELETKRETKNVFDVSL